MAAMTTHVVADRRHGAPFHLLFTPAALAAMMGTFFVDLAYWRTADIMWMQFSTWLVSAATVLLYVGALAAILDFFLGRFHVPALRGWPYLAGNLVALVLATLALLVHMRDGWTAVVPWGLTLSLLATLVLIVTNWISWRSAYDRAVMIEREIVS